MDSFYTPNMDLLLFWIPICLFAYWAHRIRCRKVHNGEMPGIKQSKTFFDWMFYNKLDK